MKNLVDFLNESFEEAPKAKVNEAEDTIKSEKDFRAAARAKFEEVFGDE